MKNYTSSVPVERTIMRIEMALVFGGAIGILKNYNGDGQLEAISFSIPSPEKRLTSVRLPADVEAVKRVMMSSVKRPREDTEKRIQNQAARTAWKLVQDWVEIQMSMIEMQQAEVLQVFLPYIHDGKRTLYAALKANNFRMLTEGVKEKP